MRSVRDLANLRENVELRVGRLADITGGAAFPLSPGDRRAIAYAVIELDNLVINCLRNFTRSVLVGCRTVSGQIVTSTSAATNGREASAEILRILNFSRFADLGSPSSIPDDQTPRFRSPSDVEKVLSSFDASNLAELQLGSGLNGLVFSEAKVLRHFFAHRCQSTNEKVRAFGQSIGIFHYENAERLALTPRPSTTTPLLIGWMDDLLDFCELVM